MQLDRDAYEREMADEANGRDDAIVTHEWVGSDLEYTNSNIGSDMMKMMLKEREESEERRRKGMWVEDDNESSIFYVDFPSLPEIPCLSSSSTLSSMSRYSSSSSSSTCSASSSSTSFWTVAKAENEDGVVENHQNREEPGIETAIAASDQPMECMDVLEELGGMDLLDSSSIWDPSSLFPCDTDDEEQQNHHHQEHELKNQEQDQVLSGDGDEKHSEDLAMVFFEWLKSNKESISPEDLRGIKLKRSTIESAARRLGGGKEGMMQLLKLILAWVQNNHLQKRRKREEDIQSMTSSYPFHQQQQNPFPVQVSISNTVFQTPNPDPFQWVSHSPFDPTFSQTPPPASPSIMGYVGDGAFSPGNNHFHCSYSPPPDYQMFGSSSSWSTHLSPYNTTFPNTSSPPFLGFANKYNSGGVQVHGVGEPLVKMAPSATKEARKKRMARQRRIYYHHRHQNHHQHQQQQQQHQQRREGPLLNGTANGLVGNDPLMRQNPGTANAMATKMYEERLKLPIQRDPLDEASIKQRFSDSASQLLDSNHASMLKSGAAPGQPSGQVLHGAAGGMTGTLQQVQPRNQQIPGVAQDIKSEINPVLNPRAAGPDGSLIGVPGSNQGSNNLTLRGWPLTGFDQLRNGILQQQKSFMQSPQSFPQLQLLSPQQQQQLLLQAQQNTTSQLAGDVDSRRLRMILNNRNVVIGKDALSSAVGDVVQNIGSPMQAASPVMPHGSADILFKKMAQLHQQQQQNSSQQQQLQQHALSSQQSQSSNHHHHQQDKMGPGSVTVDGSMSNSFRANDLASKNQGGRKRKQPVSSSGPANSSGTANTAGPSPSSAPSTPSTHTPGDVISMPSLQHSSSSTKPLIMFGSDGTGTLTSPSNQLADMDRFVEDGSLDENVDSFLSHDDADPRDTVGRCMDVSKGFTFNEVGSIKASVSKVVCCDFSSDGKLLASGGHDKKAVLWHTDSLQPKHSLEEHSLLITDVRFSPTLPRLATSSYDKTVRVWDVDNQGYSLRTFTGHSASVMSLDFHPNKEDLICSCDGNSEIRYWSINNGSCAGVSKGGTTQMRFQPRLGHYLAAAAENVVSILDVETRACRHSLQGHTKPVHSVCWDPSGDFVASVSEDSVRVWSLGSGSEGECVHELSCNGNKFHSCVFHPTYTSLLVIGCYQSLELWNMAENKTMTLSAHEGLITALAVSNATGYVASASHDKFVKLWK
eukprot:TRINITY_DN547_c0_g1_i5.p1 TRINITY_DN547_c0_g1~~TRINITY_DN547_c0_g1_i5.p1  ORF type:complete len:1206 (+),score=292.55 TRINITY_DN547_c0_g1_i5:267-3884(+)